MPTKVPTPPASEETLRDWETVQENEGDVTERLRVKAGWLYRTIVKGVGVACVFVPATFGD
ncbi:MAG: hypothetical protein ABWY78_06305 [Microvirga sp.]